MSHASAVLDPVAEVCVDPEIADLIPQFLAGRRRDVRDLERAAARCDYDEIARLGHRLRGTASGFGFERVADIAADLERAAAAASAQHVRRLTRELSLYLRRVRVRV